jgi:hypothetical protein
MTRGSYQSLHSRYNPQGEAERYIDSLNLPQNIRFFILIEPGFCYLVPALRKRNPAACIIALHAEDPAEFRPEENSPDISWFPGLGTALQDFLEAEIPDTEAAKIRIIEWRPSMNVFGKTYIRLVSETADFIKRGDANARTVKQFGRRWFINFFRNLNLLSEILVPVPFETPVLIAGAGPGLEDIIPLIREEKKRAPLLVLAVSSAVPALKARGIVPDIIISTDGGGWARLHLNECFRGTPGTQLYAAALTAALPSQCASSPILAISDGSLWQNLVLAGLGIPFIALPQRGTVSASALDLALALSKGRIYFTGVDLANRDIRTHARPYSFDRLWEEASCRFAPFYSQAFSRAWNIDKGGSHGVYAAWFKKQIALYPRRIFSLGANNHVFSGLGAAAFGETAFPGNGTASQKPSFRTVAPRFPEKAAKLGAAVLRSALAGRQGAEIVAEIGPLLFPAGHAVSVEETAEAIMKAALPAGRAGGENHGR